VWGGTGWASGWGSKRVVNVLVVVGVACIGMLAGIEFGLGFGVCLVVLPLEY